jgi:hypothetical protein
MAVNATVSSLFTPATPYADALLGGGTGIEFGVSTNGSFTPLVNKVSNLGVLNAYISHDGIAKITECKTFIQEFGTNTGFPYGGGDTAPNDYITMRDLGNASGSSKNNASGTSGGLWREMDFDVSDTNRFDHASRPTLVFIHGDNNTDGIDTAGAFILKADGMVYDSGGGTETAATGGGVDGEIGESGNVVLGDRFHDQMRILLPTSFSVGGTIQFEIAFIYAFTT